MFAVRGGDGMHMMRYFEPMVEIVQYSLNSMTFLEVIKRWRIPPDKNCTNYREKPTTFRLQKDGGTTNQLFSRRWVKFFSHINEYDFFPTGCWSGQLSTRTGTLFFTQLSLEGTHSYSRLIPGGVKLPLCLCMVRKRPLFFGCGHVTFS